MAVWFGPIRLFLTISVSCVALCNCLSELAVALLSKRSWKQTEDGRWGGWTRILWQVGCWGWCADLWNVFDVGTFHFVTIFQPKTDIKPVIQHWNVCCVMCYDEIKQSPIRPIARCQRGWYWCSLNMVLASPVTMSSVNSHWASNKLEPFFNQKSTSWTGVRATIDCAVLQIIQTQNVWFDQNKMKTVSAS